MNDEIKRELDEELAAAIAAGDSTRIFEAVDIAPESVREAWRQELEQGVLLSTPLLIAIEEYAIENRMALADACHVILANIEQDENTGEDLH